VVCYASHIVSHFVTVLMLSLQHRISISGSLSNKCMVIFMFVGLFIIVTSINALFPDPWPTLFVMDHLHELKWIIFRYDAQVTV
jgi:hypothetical protein